LLCPYCQHETTLVCSNCGKELKRRSGFNIPQEYTLEEYPYSIGEKYARYYRIAFMKPDNKHPPKIAFGCEEKPLGFMQTDKAWFNPVLIPPDKLDVLWKINMTQICVTIAFQSYLYEDTGIPELLCRLTNFFKNPETYKKLEAKSIRSFNIMKTCHSGADEACFIEEDTKTLKTLSWNTS